ncbi:MAG: hypothetical protein K2W97_08915 [Chthoniobacterales bacterium]|nr:hypothetical protein [Chthoniobacterales bacterium]
MSIPFFGLVAVVIYENFFKRKIFSARDWRAVWIFGVAASLVLYPSALGLTHIDTCSWGWSCNGLVAAVAVITIFLLWKKNAFGVLLLLALGAFAFQLQASANLWDYVIDPIYGVIAFGMMAKEGMLLRKH